MREKVFMPSTPVGPPSTYRHTARPGVTHDVLIPSGKRLVSGGGHRFGRIVLVTNAFRSRPIITTRQGVVMSPVMAAALPRRRASSRP